jgi:AcrR family transcriptional regulator
MSVNNPAGQKERFRPLPRGVNALDPETVAAEQRRRIHRALAELVAERGYRGTRVVDLLKRARVSGPTFYALCASKEGAFLSAYDEAARRGIRIAAKTERLPEGDWQGRAEAGLEAFIASILADPPMARMVVVDTPTIGPAGLQRREQAIAAFEALIAHIAQQAPGAAGVPALVIRAIVGGWREVIHHALRHERADELTGLAAGLSEWALSYKARDGEPYPSLPATTMLEAPRESERAALPAGSTQRERIVSAVAAIACAGGYAGLSVPKIVAHAGVSHEAFYQHFHDKDDAFTATYELACELTLAGVAHAHNDALAHGGQWPDAVAAGITALTRLLAAETPLARMGLIDALQAGPQTADTRERYLASFATLLAPGQQLRPSTSPIASHAIVGGIYEIIRQEINHERTDRLVELAPALTFIALAPFVGVEEAGVAAGGG